MSNPRQKERLLPCGGVWLRLKETADGPRYRMCGNGVGAAVAEWIAERIVEADAALRDSEAA
jgi:hypothetical protein